MGSKVFNQIMLIIAVALLILMFFFPNANMVKKTIMNRIEVLTFLLVIGLYIKDLLKG